MSLIGALTKAAKAGEAAKKTAPFYSAVDEALGSLKRPKGTGMEFLTEVMKQPGVKKAEIADRKLEEAFKAKGKMTKEEAQQVLKENPPPKLQERVIDDTQKLDEDELKEIISQEMYGKPYDEVYNQGQRSRVFDEAMRRMDAENGTVYGDYKTPGGENYREILLKLPTSRPNASNYSDPAKYDADLRAFNASGKKDYQSSHWKEDPNVLAHMRVQDRTGPNGEKILHVEEIQSDWHQEGRRKGYMPSQQEIEAMNRRSVQIEAKGLDATPEEKKEWADIMNRLPNYGGGRQVPDAPFKKNWHELAMKRLLNYAADNGYDSIAITPGAEQASRYSLNKQVDQVMASQEEGGLRLFARDKQGKNHDLGVHPSEKLADVVGKDLAEKMATQTKPNEIYQGVDLEVGGEGMKGFYDQILPSYLNTFGKPYGAQVRQIPLSMKIDPKLAASDDALLSQLGVETPKVAPTMLHNFPITPEMRESIKQKGLPLYQQIGIPTAGAGAASQMPEQMQEPELEPEVKKADGGAITMNQLTPEELTAQLQAYKQNAPTTAEDFAKQQSLWGDYANRYANSSWDYANMGGKAQDYSLKPADYLQKQVTGYADPINQFLSGTQQNTPTYTRTQEELSANPEISNIISQVAKTNPDFAKYTPVNDALIHNLSSDIKQFGSDTAMHRFLGNQQNLVGFGTDTQAGASQSMADPAYAAYNDLLNSYTPTASDEAWNKQAVLGLPKGSTASTPYRDPTTGKGLSVQYNEETGQPQGVRFINQSGLGNVTYTDPADLVSSAYASGIPLSAFDALAKQTGTDVLKPSQQGLRDGSYFPTGLEKGFGLKDLSDANLAKTIASDEWLKFMIADAQAKNTNPADYAGGLNSVIAKYRSQNKAAKDYLKKLGYADGGAVNYNTAPDMSDGGRIIQGAPFKRGGKVAKANNLDTMFLELSDKKLKRK